MQQLVKPYKMSGSLGNPKCQEHPGVPHHTSVAGNILTERYPRDHVAP